MARSRRLSPVLRIEQNKERTAANVVSKARQVLTYYQKKLTELKDYQHEYSQSLNSNQAKTMSATQLNEFRGFMRQLDEGIRLLTEKVEGQKQLNLHDERQWINAKKRTDALDKLISNFKSRERNLSESREANEIDDRTSQRHKSDI